MGRGSFKYCKTFLSVYSYVSDNPAPLLLAAFLNLLYFEWSPPWNFKSYLDVYILTFDLTSYLIIYFDILYAILSAAESCDLSFATLWSWACCSGRGILWCSTCSWVRSDHLHSDQVLALRVRRGTLGSSTCSWRPAGNTLDSELFLKSYRPSKPDFNSMNNTLWRP